MTDDLRDGDLAAALRGDADAVGRLRARQRVAELAGHLEVVFGSQWDPREAFVQRPALLRFVLAQSDRPLSQRLALARRLAALPLTPTSPDSLYWWDRRAEVLYPERLPTDADGRPVYPRCLRIDGERHPGEGEDLATAALARLNLPPDEWAALRARDP